MNFTRNIAHRVWKYRRLLFSPWRGGDSIGTVVRPFAREYKFRRVERSFRCSRVFFYIQRVTVARIMLACYAWMDVGASTSKRTYGGMRHAACGMLDLAEERDSFGLINTRPPFETVLRPFFSLGRATRFATTDSSPILCLV